MNNNKTNLISIDIARATAALGVYSYHQHIGALLAKYTKIPFFDSLDSFGAFYSVPLFFLISGYCIHLSNLKYVKLNSALPLKLYYKRRFLRIYPPYLAAVIISVLVLRITHFGELPSFQDSIVHLFSVQGFTVKYFNTINLVLWTITVEIAFYIIYPIFYHIRLKYSLNTALVFTLIVSVLNILYFSVQKTLSLPQFFWVGNIWFSWCTGAFVADKLFFDPKAFSKQVFKIVYLLIAILFVICLYFQPGYLSIASFQLKILIWTGPLVYLLSKELWLKQQKSFILNGIIYLGLSSYSLYLLHEPLISLRNYVVHTYMPVKLQTIGLIISIVVIPFITWLNYLYVEKPFIIKKKS